MAVMLVNMDYFEGDERTNWQRMTAGDPYIADDPMMAERSGRAWRLSEQYREAYLARPEEAAGLLADLIGDLGSDVTLRPPVRVDYGDFITIGDRTEINFNLTALDVAPIVIGADCLIGPNVQLLTATHPLDPDPRRARVEGAKPITLEGNVWLGGGVIVLAGVTIGENSIVGAGSVVTKDVPANVVVAGNPARVIRNL